MLERLGLGRNRRLIAPTAFIVAGSVTMIVLGVVLHVLSVTYIGTAGIGWIAGYHKGANTVIRIIRHGGTLD